MSKGEAHPSFDPQQEAADALHQLLGADVVLTSYEVLRQEVHYSPESASVHSLRRAKKYAVAESPLLSVRSVVAVSAVAAVAAVNVVCCCCHCDFCCCCCYCDY